MSNTEIAQFDLRVRAPSSLGTPFYEFDEPLTVALNVGPYELDLDNDPAPTAEEPLDDGLPVEPHREEVRGAREVGPGSLLGNRYRIEAAVGMGGSAMLFSARDLYGTYVSSGQEPLVAVKVLHPELRHHHARTQRLMREFNYMRRLVHPSIARVFDLQCDGGIWFMVLELLKGQSLSRYIARNFASGIPLRQAIRILTECTEALICTHQRGICHGDLKPGNVIIDERGSAHLIDFGAVPELDDEPQTTLFATPAYASPQLLNQRIATARDDLFSLGCIAYELFTGRHPFGLLSSLEARRKALQPGYDERIPREIFDAVQQLLAWEREFRPADALEFLNSLAAVDLNRSSVAEAAVESEEDVATESRSELPLTEALAEQVSGPATETIPAGQSIDRHGNWKIRVSALAGRAIGLCAAMRERVEQDVRRHWPAMRGQAERLRRRLLPALPVRSAKVQSDAVLRVPPKRDTVPVAAVAGVAALAFLVLHWSNAARAPYRPSTASLAQQHLAALAAAPIPLMDIAIAIPEPALIAEPVSTTVTPAPIRPANGRVWLTAAKVHVASGQQMAVVNLRRDRSTEGVAPVAWTIAPGTAKPGVDFDMPKVRVARFNDGQEIRTLFVPLKPAKPGRPERRFTIKLQKTPQGPAFGPITQTEVIIGAAD